MLKRYTITLGNTPETQEHTKREHKTAKDTGTSTQDGVVKKRKNTKKRNNAGDTEVGGRRRRKQQA